MVGISQITFINATLLVLMSISFVRAFGLLPAAETDRQINASLDSVRAKFYKDVAREVNTNANKGIRCTRVDVPDTLDAQDCDIFTREGYACKFAPGYHIGEDNDWIPRHPRDLRSPTLGGHRRGRSPIIYFKNII